MPGVAVSRANSACPRQSTSLLCQVMLSFSMGNMFLLLRLAASTLLQSQIKERCIAGVKQSSAN